MKKPDFFIVGGMKCGTTSLVHLLNQSDEVYVPPHDIHYFSTKYDPDRLSDYLNEFRESDRPVIGDKSASYSFYENSAERIHEFNPKAKIIWVLRNPVDRAFSNYLHVLKNGLEIKSFRDCFEEDEERFKRDSRLAYFKRSMYHEQVASFARYFATEQMAFILFEDLVRDPQSCVDQLSGFLKVGDFQISALKNSQMNRTILPRNKFLEYYSRKMLGQSFAYKVVHRLNQSKGKRISMEEEDIAVYKDYFKPFNEILAKQTSLDLSVWE